VARVLRSADAIPLSILALLVTTVTWNRLRFDWWLGDFDILSFYLPWYGHLGARLRDFDVPGWAPHLMSGVPFAGDPQSGWTYLPAMLGFALLAPVTAFKAMIAAQIVIAVVSTYAFCRVLGMIPAAALVGAVTYLCGPFLHWGANGGTIMAHLAAWLPLSLLGVELALRAATWRGRVIGWWLGALGVSQMLAGWLGQGSVYGLLVVGSYAGYRAILAHPEAGRALRERLLDAVKTGAAVVGLGVALVAAGLLPRLDVIAETTMSDGYDNLVGTGASYPAIELETLLYRLLASGLPARPVAWGAAAAALVLLAPVLAGRRFGTLYFLGMTATTLILVQPPSLLHDLYFLIPRFEDLHVHDPFHVLVVTPIGVAVLSGASVHALAESRARRRALPFIGIVALLLGLAAYAGSEEIRFVGWPALLAGGTVLAVAAVALAWRRDGRAGLPATRFGALIPAVYLACVFAHPAALEVTGSWLDWPRDRTWAAAWGDDPSRDSAVVANGASADPDGAGAFLRQLGLEGVPFRYVGYGGYNDPNDPERRRSYMTHRFDPRISALLVNGRPLLLELDEIQGYNPVQLRRYAEFITAMNGWRANYHVLYLLPEGADSPMLALLNMRYVVLDTSLSPDRPDVAALTAGRREVFRDEFVAVYEAVTAPAYAWIVYDVRQIEPGAALPLLESGEIDPSQTALVEGAPPPVSAPGDRSGDAAVVTQRAADTISIATTSSADGFLVVSEMYSSGWRAYVDGKPVDILPTNHILRGVALPAGEHIVELRYQPRSLTLGLIISGTAVAAMLVSMLAAAAGPERTRRPSTWVRSINARARPRPA
jgi:hypothetical protein